MTQPINPYIAGKPLREGQGFFGRKDLLEAVDQELRNLSTNALVLFGQRRIGKTSLLRRLEYTLPRDCYLPVYFDLQDQAERSLGQVLADLGKTTAKCAGLPFPDLDDFDDEGRYFGTNFLDQLQQKLGQACRPVFLLDEFDVLEQFAEEQRCGQIAAKALFPFLRNLMIQNPWPAFVVAVGRHVHDLSYNYKATFKIFLEREVGVLKRENAEQLVRQAEGNGTLHFVDDAVERVLSLTAGHPYLTQLLCQRIWERAYKGYVNGIPVIDVTAVDAAIPDALEMGGHALEWIWDGLSPAEKIYAAALAGVAEKEVLIPQAKVMQILDDQAARLRSLNVELAPRDLVERRILEGSSESGYSFTIELIRRWMCQNKPLEVVKEELDQVDSRAVSLFEVGRTCFNKEEWREAVEYFRRALKHHEGHFRAQLYLGEALLKLNEIGDAVREFERAFELDNVEARSSFVRALVVQAKKLREDGQEEEALKVCGRVLTIAPGEQQALELQASIWVQLRDWDHAIKAYEDLLKLTEGEELRKGLEVKLRDTQEQKQREAAKRWPNGYILDDAYEIERLIVETDFNEIYYAKERQPPGAQVIIKRLKPDRMRDPEAYKRFIQELTILRRLNDKNILSFYGGSSRGINRYLVTEYADQGSLKEYLETRPDHKLETMEALQIALCVCKGIEAVHEMGIIHSDIKPANIYLFAQSEGKSCIAKLGDFSIAFALKDLSATIKMGLFVGTPAYASPEQIQGEVGDQRSDLFSWAIVFFEMLTGESPTLSLKDPLTLAPKQDAFPESFFMGKGIPHGLIEVLQRNLTTDPKQRYQSAAEVRRLLETIPKQIAFEIQEHLSRGEEQMRSFQWEAALSEFDQGLSLCQWYEEHSEDYASIKKLAEDLRLKRLCTQGMVHRERQEWQAAVAIFEQLRSKPITWPGLDIEEQFRFVESRYRLEQEYQTLLLYKKEEKWGEIIDRATESTKSYKSPLTDESIGDILALALYAQGKRLLKGHQFESAYNLFYRLYKEDPNYDDDRLREECAEAAYQNAQQMGTDVSWAHQVKWYERALDLDPGHRKGRTRQDLNKVRYQWAGELSTHSEIPEAIKQLERISSDFPGISDVEGALTEDYYDLLRNGHYERSRHVNLNAEAEAYYKFGKTLYEKGRLEEAVEQLEEAIERLKKIDSQARYQEAMSALAFTYRDLGQQAVGSEPCKAIQWWNKAITVSPSLEELLRKKIGRAEWQCRVIRSQMWIGLILALLAILVDILLARRGPTPIPTVTPTPATIVSNGDFTDRLEGWQQGGALKSSVHCNKGEDLCYAVLGNPSYQCGGGVPEGMAGITQSLSIPESMINPTLSLNYQIRSQDLFVEGQDKYDYFAVFVDGDEKYRDGNTQWERASCVDIEKVWNSGLMTETIDLSPYRGKEIEISFRNVNSGDSFYNTWTYVTAVRVKDVP
ncbi:MAG: protein kinase [Anaerolineae bacterium]|nr:protein kinase [Anaerolineae bacterium]